MSVHYGRDQWRLVRLALLNIEADLHAFETFQTISGFL